MGKGMKLDPINFFVVNSLPEGVDFVFGLDVIFQYGLTVAPRKGNKVCALQPVKSKFTEIDDADFTATFDGRRWEIIFNYGGDGSGQEGPLILCMLKLSAKLIRCYSGVSVPPIYPSTDMGRRHFENYSELLSKQDQHVNREFLRNEAYEYRLLAHVRASKSPKSDTVIRLQNEIELTVTGRQDPPKPQNPCLFLVGLREIEP